MEKEKVTSDLKSHKYKKGLIQPPMNTLPNIQTVSWTNDRIPEYIWLGLILMCFERTEGIEKVSKMLKEINSINECLFKPKLSIILSLPNNEQKKIYEIICNNIDPKIISPLTLIYRNLTYPIFNQYFNDPEIPIEYKIRNLSKSIKTYYDHQSFESTDLRFVILLMMVFQKKLHIVNDCISLEVFEKYPYMKHSDEKMCKYRPLIRTLEMTDFEISKNQEFIDTFWKEIGLKTNCNLILIEMKNEDKDMNYREYISNYQDKVEYLLRDKKEDLLKNDKFNVIIGTVTYVLKIFNEIIENELENGILGRHAFRTILESFVNIKYILKLESEHPTVWKEYKLYGVGKYKLPLLKEREFLEKSTKTHFIPPIIDVIVNEIVWEEFLDVDLRYFDNKKIKDKFEEIGEKQLYDVLYEYDNNFIHGFWGAVRDSSMLHCDNATHKYHSVPDIGFQQKMPSVANDIYLIMEKFKNIIDEVLDNGN